MTLWYVGGPEDFETHCPLVYYVMPASMKAVVAVTSPPLTPEAMMECMLGLSSVPIIGQALQVTFLSYADYYNTTYLANPPGSSSSTPPLPDLPANYTPDWQADQTVWEMLKILYTNVNLAYDEAHAAHLAADLILDRLPTGGTVPIASQRDTNILLAALYYIAQMPIAYALTVDDANILLAISQAKDALDAQLDAHDANLNGARNDIADIHTDLGNARTVINGIDTIADDIQADVHDLLARPAGGGGGPTGFPGTAEVDYGTPIEWDGPVEITQAMDGCLLEITSVPNGTGRQVVGDINSWQHMGWLAFIADAAYGDELQYLNLEAAVYAPKRIQHPTGVLLFPRPGSSGTLTPWTYAS